MSVSDNPADTFDKSPLPNRLFLIAILAGTILRVIAGAWGDIGVYVDGASRIALSMRWAEHPVWEGLSGVWPPTHVYILGTLIRFWNQPVWWAKIFGLACGLGTIFVFRSAVRHRFGATVASLCALLLAVYWTHIWLTSSYWVEVPYLLFVLLAVDHAEKTKTTLAWKHALASSLFLSLAILLRNEGLLLLGLFAFWYLICIRNLKLFAIFVLIPTALTAWYFIEPALHGGSYFDYFSFVARSKEFENLVEGITRKDALFQWILMLSAAPTLMVVVPGLYGLWENRRRAVTDLFAWMFVAQVTFYFSLTLVSAWRPQLRYLLIQFVNLFPYAALAWVKIMRRFSSGYVLPAMLVLMITMQGGAWWIGRNNRLAGGWLPLQVITSSQRTIDEFTGRLNALHQPPIKIVSIVPGPRAERWALEHSFVVNRLRSDQSFLREHDVHSEPELLNGITPPEIDDADLILIDPQAVFYSTILSAITREKPNLVITRIHPHIDALLLTERARKDVESILTPNK